MSKLLRSVCQKKLKRYLQEQGGIYTIRCEVSSLRDSVLAESWQSIIMHFLKDSIAKTSFCKIIDCHEVVPTSHNDKAGAKANANAHHNPKGLRNDKVVDLNFNPKISIALAI